MFPFPFTTPRCHLCGSEGLAETGATLSAGQVLTANNLLGLLDNLLSLSQDELDVAGVRHVRVNLEKKLVSMFTISLLL